MTPLSIQDQIQKFRLINFSIDLYFYICSVLYRGKIYEKRDSKEMMRTRKRIW
jgi:hypothetical protein